VDGGGKHEELMSLANFKKKKKIHGCNGAEPSRCEPIEVSQAEADLRLKLQKQDPLEYECTKT
jgi:hypothetical protein